jgi:hypothetical protein
MEADSLFDVVEQLLELWISGDVSLTGMIVFLEANGIVSPIENEEPMEFDEEDPDNEPLIDAMNETVMLVCGLCRDNPAKLAEFVAAIAPSVTIDEIKSGGPDEKSVLDKKDE